MAIDFKAIREAAGLGALPAVRAAATEDFAGQALARIGDAEGPVDKNLQGKAGGVSGGWEFGEFAKGEFTGEDGEGDSLAAGKGDAFGRGESHLGRGMDGNLRADFSSQSNKSEILNDDGIDIGFSDPAKEAFGFG